MDDFLFVNIVQPLAYLSNDRTDICLFHSPVLSQLLKELPICAKLNKQINIFFILKVTIEGSNLSMAQIELDA
jgi:hypothetical protein